MLFCFFIRKGGEKERDQEGQDLSLQGRERETSTHWRKKKEWSPSEAGCLSQDVQEGRRPKMSLCVVVHSAQMGESEVCIQHRLDINVEGGTTASL